jgi:autotransporter-associated beta strand protein
MLMKTKSLLVSLIAALMSGALMSQSDAQITGVDDNIVSSNLDGSGFYRLPTIAGVGGDLTMESWVNLRSYASFGRFVELGNGQDQNNIGLGTIGTSGRPIFFVTGFGAVEGPQALGTNTWVHVAGVLQPDRTMRLYVNGTQVATATASGDVPVLNRTSNFVGESNWDADSLLNGGVADVRVWNTARTQAEIQNNMPVGSITGPTTGLVAAYAFGATGATPTADLSGNGYTATQNGNITYSKFDTGTLTTGGFSGANLNVAEGQLNLTGTNSVGTLTVNNGTVTQAAGTSVTTSSSGNNFVVGVSAGQSGSYAISGGTLQFGGSNANAFIGQSGTGTMTQTGGAVTANGFAVIGRFSGGVGNYTISGGSLSQTATNRLLIVGEEGTGTLTVSGTGSVTAAGGIFLSHAAGGVGTVNLDGGTISAASVTKGSGSTATFNFNGGTLEATGNNANFMSGLNAAVLQAGGGTIDDGGFQIGIGQVLSGTGSLEKTGSGRLTLSGNNTYAGLTTVNGGTLQLGAGSSDLRNNSSDFVINNGSTLALGGTRFDLSNQSTGGQRTITFGASGGNTLDTQNVNFVHWHGATYRTTGGSQNAILGAGLNLNAGVVATFDVARGTDAESDLLVSAGIGNAGSIVKTGNGIATLAGNNGYSGTTTISAGTLQVGNGGSTGNLGNSSSVINNASLVFNRSDSSLTAGNPISGSGSVTKIGAGTVTLSGNNSYTGVTIVNAGTLQLGAGGGTYSNNASDFVINNGSTLAFGGGRFDLNNQSTGGQRTITFGAGGGNTLDTRAVSVVDWKGSTYQSQGGSRNVILGAGLNINAGVVATFNVARGTDADADLAVSVVWNAGSIVKNGDGIMTLANAAYTGSTTVNAGVLSIAGGSGSAGSTATGSFTIGDGATLRVTAEQFWFNGTPTFNFTSDGGGTIDTASGVNFVMGGNGTFTTAGGARNEIIGSSGINLNTRTVTLNVARGSDATSDLLLSTGIVNSGSLVKTGNGIATLSGSNNYTGTTTISQGTLQVGDGGTSGNLGTGNVVNDAALVFNRAGSLTVGNTISGSGTLEKTGPGTVTLSAANSYTGLTTV